MFTPETILQSSLYFPQLLINIHKSMPPEIFLSLTLQLLKLMKHTSTKFLITMPFTFPNSSTEKPNNRSKQFVSTVHCSINELTSKDTNIHFVSRPNGGTRLFKATSASVLRKAPLQPGLKEKLSFVKESGVGPVVHHDITKD